MLIAAALWSKWHFAASTAAFEEEKMQMRVGDGEGERKGEGDGNVTRLLIWPAHCPFPADKLGGRGSCQFKSQRSWQMFADLNLN